MNERDHKRERSSERLFEREREIILKREREKEADGQSSPLSNGRIMTIKESESFLAK